MKNIIMTLLVSMAPVLELRGGIPFGVAKGLGLPTSFLIAFIGNMIPVPFILLFVRVIFDWLKMKSAKLDAMVCRFEAKAEKKKGTIEKYKWWGLVIIVAIPLPGTGAWTGAMIAALMDVRIKRALPAIALGVAIAGIIVCYITYGATLIIK